MSARMFTWDWRGQPDMDQIAAYVNDMPGPVHMAAYDTGTDEYAWIVSDHHVDDDEAERLWRS